ncbi:hypothetical protein VNO77_16297 [Canavalia gladiata]|uniref:Uncharacterized protein n=1 Tax=Canavalia gladiata TaxID=3824 RepID=A0AAN9M0T1_CANGL
MYAQAGSQFHDELLLHNLPSSLVKAIDARLEGIQPKVQSSDSISSGYIAGEIKPVGVNTKKSSPTAKSHQGRPLFLEPYYWYFVVLYLMCWNYSVLGKGDVTDKAIDPIKVYSEELIREIEKIASTLVPEKDRSIRIAAMQRIEGLVLGALSNIVDEEFQQLWFHLYWCGSWDSGQRREGLNISYTSS